MYEAYYIPKFLPSPVLVMTNEPLAVPKITPPGSKQKGAQPLLRLRALKTDLKPQSFSRKNTVGLAGSMLMFVVVIPVLPGM